MAGGRGAGEQSRIGGRGAEGLHPADENTPANAAGTLHTPELGLGDEEARSPWLEEDDDADYTRHGAGQRLIVLLFCLVLLALVAGGIWAWMRAASPSGLVAAGGVIEAPDEPYKERPANPGGRPVAGTGKTSFAVAEGKTRLAQLGNFEPLSEPGSATARQVESETEAQFLQQSAVLPGKGDAAVSSGVGVQVAAYATREAATAGWRELTRHYSQLDGLEYRIIEGPADFGTVYRLQAVPGDRAAARALCDSLRASGLNCHIKR